MLKFYMHFRRMFRIVHQLIAFPLPHGLWDVMRHQHGFQSYILRKKTLNGSHNAKHPFLLAGGHSSLPKLDLLEPRLVESRTSVIIPLDDRVLFIRLLHRTQFSSRLSEGAQTLDSISRIQFFAGGGGLGEGRPLGTV
jgi:hypothetical protein